MGIDYEKKIAVKDFELKTTREFEKISKRETVQLREILKFE